MANPFLLMLEYSLNTMHFVGCWCDSRMLFHWKLIRFQDKIFFFKHHIGYIHVNFKIFFRILKLFILSINTVWIYYIFSILEIDNSSIILNILYICIFVIIPLHSLIIYKIFDRICLSSPHKNLSIIIIPNVKCNLSIYQFWSSSYRVQTRF